MNKIAIIGTNGFLSTSIAKRFMSEGWIVDMYGLEAPTSHECNSFTKVNLVTESIDFGSILGHDIIVYAVGAGIQSNLKEGPSLIYNLNVNAPLAICNGLKQFGYKGVFVTFGSVFEMGETSERRPFNEDDIAMSRGKAPNDYTVSKRLLTRFVNSYSHEFTHWHFIIPTIYGPGENPHRLIPYTIDAILNNKELHFTSGDQVRQYVYVDEVPHILLLGLNKDMHSGIYNIEGAETITVRELVEMIHKKLGRSLAETCFGSEQRVDAGMRYLALDGSKLRQACGFKAETSVMDVIHRY